MLKTLAFQINDDLDYSLAVAVLDPHFLTQSTDSQKGRIVVLNELGVVNPGGMAKTIALTNAVYDPQDFFEKYRLHDDENGAIETDIVDVVRK